MTTWAPIRKGDRRPEGFVLVTYARGYKAEAKMLRAIFGEGAIVDEPVEWRVTVARWRTDYKRWYADSPRLDSIPNVIAWAPLPEPYQPEEGNE
jgi:hypothetical protein